MKRLKGWMLAAGILLFCGICWAAQQPSTRPAAEADPDMSLSLNGQQDQSLFVGTPMLLTARLRNTRAADAASINLARRSTTQAVAEMAKTRQLHPTLAKRMLAAPLELQDVPLIRLPRLWPARARILVRQAQGPWQPIPWTATPLAIKPQPDVLDEQNAAEASWSVAPESAATIAPGKWELKAVLEIAPEQPPDPPAWRGSVESPPVILNVQKRPENPTRADALGIALAEGHYWLAVGKSDEALAAGNRAVRSDAESTAARILLADLLRVKGNSKEAMAEYIKAAKLFYAQNPNSTTPPTYLNMRIRQLWEDEPGKPPGK